MENTTDGEPKFRSDRSTCRSPAVVTALHVLISCFAPSVASYVVECAFAGGFESLPLRQPPHLDAVAKPAAFYARRRQFRLEIKVEIKSTLSDPSHPETANSDRAGDLHNGVFSKGLLGLHF